MTSNPLRILQALDRHLHQPFELYVYGRSALALGFPAAPAAMHGTMDVDAILPARDILAIETNDDFWRAQEKANTELGDSGLYFTHLFEDRQVILTPHWLARVVKLPVRGLKYLHLYRPATEDLILTKMMRVDPQDREDIMFLLGQADLDKEQLREALEAAVIPDVAEIKEAFERNKTWLIPRL
jgi:Nucleotidyltransferase of unknown function (DUF6036)